MFEAKSWKQFCEWTANGRTACNTHHWVHVVQMYIWVLKCALHGISHSMRKHAALTTINGSLAGINIEIQHGAQISTCEASPEHDWRAKAKMAQVLFNRHSYGNHASNHTTKKAPRKTRFARRYGGNASDAEPSDRPDSIESISVLQSRGSPWLPVPALWEVIRWAHRPSPQRG